MRLNTCPLPKPTPHRDSQGPSFPFGDTAEVISGYLGACTTHTRVPRASEGQVSRSLEQGRLFRADWSALRSEAKHRRGPGSLCNKEGKNRQQTVGRGEIILGSDYLLEIKVVRKF